MCRSIYALYHKIATTHDATLKPKIYNKHRVILMDIWKQEFNQVNGYQPRVMCQKHNTQNIISIKFITHRIILF